MSKNSLILTTVLLFFLTNAQAQLKHLHLNVSLNGGYSVLQHKTDFQTTPLFNLYEFVAISHGGQDKYTWDDFQATYQVREKFGQPRLGFTGQLTYKDWPIIIEGQALSSSSAYTKAAYAVCAGLGKNVYFADSSFYFSF
ncbi:MAG: hypothetical protein R2778_08870 [Saprospiraceae bacterium]